MGIIIYCLARGHEPGQKMPPQKTMFDRLMDLLLYWLYGNVIICMHLFVTALFNS